MGVALIQLLQAAIWPGLLLFLILKYGSDVATELRSLLPRMKSAGPKGFEFEVAEQQKKSEHFPSPTNLDAKSTAFPSATPAVSSVRTQIEANILNIDPNIRQNILINALAETRLLFLFERAYRLILGSQIQGLKHLNVRVSATIEEAKDAYEGAKQAYPTMYENFGFDSWIGFLLSQNFIELDKDIITITDIGRDFLGYLIDQRMDEHKLG